ncbi:unnamed protein product [Brachionus calyciflorus]|uniref:Uncharacterized protein n=1 Tax=Brachionus calyciflorus TaxID=104777 RepID=A0A814CE41_9BILA|nr:unnamed protein product [Brachionus calyciflorus]
MMLNQLSAENLDFNKSLENLVTKPKTQLVKFESDLKTDKLFTQSASQTQRVQKPSTPCIESVKNKKEMEMFLSKNNIEEEIQKAKQQSKPVDKPSCVLKEKKYNGPIVQNNGVNNPNAIILNKIDFELEKIERSSLQNQKKSLTQPNLAENVRIYDLPDQNLDVLMNNLDLYNEP